ncbi:MAG: hypothetical protein ACI9G1_005567 [Pirellulaceae bacterium]|jgi:hypothetical protein
MFKPRLAKVWHGKYRYDINEHLDRTEKEVQFEMHLELKWFGRFTGEIAEDETGIPEWAKVKGQVTGQSIQFSKQYPSLWASNENGEMVTIPGQSSVEILYQGKLSDDHRSIVGTWQIPFQTRIIFEQECEFAESTGTWIAKVAD